MDDSNLMNDMFNPYSSVWSVSGTSAPLWSWLISTDNVKDDKGNQTSQQTIGFSQIGDSDSYDIKTNDLVAPFSQFSRWQMIDYSGIRGVLYSGDRQLINRYFDTELARAGEMWSNEEPTYSNIIEAFSHIDAGRYKLQDFIYNKYFRMIPPNYLITLRRYAMPCSDEPFTLAYPEEIHHAIHSRSTLLPMATATTYMSEVAGNKMDDILKFTFGMNFSEKTSEIQSISSGTPGATGFGIGQEWHNMVMAGGNGNKNLGIAFKGGFAASGVNFLGSTNLTPAQMEVAGQYAQVDPWAKYSKYTQGPVDVVMKTKIRDQGLNFTHDFGLKFEYELKSLKYVNPKIAMLDIIGNMITMSTNSGTFWGGATRYYGNGGGYGKQPGDLDAFARGDYATYAKSLVDHVTDQVKAMNGGGWPQDLEDWVNLAKNIFKGGLSNMLGSLINGNLGKLGFTQPANALLNDEPTGYWHVTIGNPLNPVAMMGNMCLTDMEMTMGEGLGYDDFPVNVMFSCKLSHGKPRDAAGIEAIFNAGKGRYMHTPFLAELDGLEDPEMKAEIQGIIKQVGNKKDPMGVGQHFGEKKSAESAIYAQYADKDGNVTKKPKFSTSSQSPAEANWAKEQIDTIARFFR